MSELNFTHSNGNKVKLTTPDTLAANKTFKLPVSDGNAGEFLKKLMDRVHYLSQHLLILVVYKS